MVMVFGDQERREVMSRINSALQCSVNIIGEEQWVSTAKSSTDDSSGKQQGGHTSPVPQRIFPVESNPVLVEMKNKRHNDFQLILVFNMHKSWKHQWATLKRRIESKIYKKI